MDLGILYAQKWERGLERQKSATARRDESKQDEQPDERPRRSRPKASPEREPLRPRACGCP